MTTEQKPIYASPEAELDAIKEAIHAKLEELFKEHGKEYVRGKGEWGNGLRLDVGFCSFRRGWGVIHNKHHIRLELTPSYWDKTVNKDGHLTTFRRVTRKIELTQPLPDIYKEMERVVDKMPGYLEGIQQALAIQASAQERRDAASEKHALLTQRLSEITGYQIEYGDRMKVYHTPYRELKISRGTDTVEATIQWPLEDFEVLHKAIDTLNQERLIKRASESAREAI